MRKIQSFLFFIAAAAFLISCRTNYQPSSVLYKDYRITKKENNNPAITTLLKPYADSVNSSMNDVIAVSSMQLENKQPEGTLGNLLSDAMLIMAKEKYNTDIDVAFVNYTGIRLPSIPAGNITRGKVFEMAPFDNIIVLLKIKGKIFKQFLQLVSAKGGWPCSGMSFQLKDKEPVNIKIGNTTFDEDKEYTIALVDYLANGGDDCEMLKKVPQQNNGYLFRAALIEYFTKLNKEGKQISASLEKRISYAN